MAADGDPVLLTLPHPPRQGERIYLLLTLGVLNDAREVDVETADGLFIGLASPFAIPPGKPAGTYIIPIPAAMVHENRLSLRFRVPLPGGSSRPAGAEEIRDAKIRLDGPEELK